MQALWLISEDCSVPSRLRQSIKEVQMTNASTAVYPARWHLIQQWVLPASVTIWDLAAENQVWAVFACWVICRCWHCSPILACPVALQNTSTGKTSSYRHHELVWSSIWDKLCTWYIAEVFLNNEIKESSVSEVITEVIPWINLEGLMMLKQKISLP